MSNLKESLKTQQRINDGVKAILDYFGPQNESYAGHLEQMLNAQTQIIGLMEMAKKQAVADRNNDFFCQSEDIIYFLHYANDYLRMLKPFAEMAGEGGDA